VERALADSLGRTAIEPARQPHKPPPDGDRSRESARDSPRRESHDSLIAPLFLFVPRRFAGAALYRFANTGAMWDITDAVSWP